MLRSSQPFLPKAHHPPSTSSYWEIFSVLSLDLRTRVTQLSALGLFPSYFGNDVTRVFAQKYTGDCTIVPRMRSPDTVGVKAFLNPTREDMRHYLKNGAIATYPFVNHIRRMVGGESELDDGDDLIMVRESGGEEGAKERVRELEEEVRSLKRELKEARKEK